MNTTKTSGLNATIAKFLGFGVALDQHIIGTYFSLRICMIILALGLPLVLWIGGENGVWLEKVLHQQNSLSAYYHAIPDLPCRSRAGVYRDLFVGILCAISICLIAYKGFSTLENLLLSASGIFLALVAFFPMGWPPSETIGCPNPNPDFFNGTTIPGIPAMQIHFTAAILFFILLIITVLFTSKSTLRLVEDSKLIERHGASALVRRWKQWYNYFSVLMVAIPSLVMALGKIVIPSWHAHVFWAEAAGIYIFALYWALKTLEIWSTKLNRLFLSDGPLKRD